MTYQMCGIQFLLFSILFALGLPCLPPDVPVKGSYSPVKWLYLAGDIIKYECYGSFLNGNADRVCQPNDTWSGATPFCDTPVQTKSFSGSSVGYRSSPQAAVDAETSSCFKTKSESWQHFSVYFDPAIVNVIRLFVPSGLVTWNISLFNNGSETICPNVNRILENNQWLIINCDVPSVVESIYVQDISGLPRALEICEVEIYVKDDIWCDQPPDVFTPNGRLQVARDKATLQCNVGFRPGQNTQQIECDTYGNWNRTSLQCTELLCDLHFINNTSGGEWKILFRPPKFYIGMVMTLECHRGYIIQGPYPHAVKCLESGNWSSSSARCEMISFYESTWEFIIIVITCMTAVVCILSRKKWYHLFKGVKPNILYNHMGSHNQPEHPTTSNFAE